jgi:hypothetical protein
MRRDWLNSFFDVNEAELTIFVLFLPYTEKNRESQPTERTASLDPIS